MANCPSRRAKVGNSHDTDYQVGVKRYGWTKLPSVCLEAGRANVRSFRLLFSGIISFDVP